MKRIILLIIRFLRLGRGRQKQRQYVRGRSDEIYPLY